MFVTTASHATPLERIPEDAHAVMKPAVESPRSSMRQNSDWTTSTASTVSLQDEEWSSRSTASAKGNPVTESQEQWELAASLVHHLSLTLTLPPLPRSALDQSAKKSVRFGTIAIRRYDVTLGDHPSVTHGLPLTLDWTYTLQPTILVDDYEDMKCDVMRKKPHRVLLKRMHMSKVVRANFLTNAGFTQEQVRAAKLEVKTVQRQRYVSSLVWPVEHVHAALQHQWQKRRSNHRPVMVAAER